MKANIEFDLSDIDDKMSHMRCVKSLDMAIVLFEIIYNMKKNIQRRSNIKPEDELDAFYNQLNDLLEEHNINIEELII